MLTTAMLLLLAACDGKTLGEIDFFGYQGFNIDAIRSALPFHEGESFPPRVKSSDELKRMIGEKVNQVIGHEPTSISFVCCDSKQRFMVYIGLPGTSFQTAAFHSAPAGDIRFAPEAMKLHEALDNAFLKAVLRGHATEDDSEGYTLTNDPEARKRELAVREYALHNEKIVLQVLAESSDATHRAAAAQILGYGRQSDQQVDALVEASLDPDDDVRNNASRALAVLAGAKPNLAQRVPVTPFIGLLKSGSWGDHNKASLLLTALTKSRDSKVLAELRSEALDALIEMARWRSDGHAEAARLLLGRIAGIEEDRLNKLIDAGQVDAILDALHPR
jgi:hypothetical protein